MGCCIQLKLMVPGLSSSSNIPNRTQRFGNWKRFRPQVKRLGGTYSAESVPTTFTTIYYLFMKNAFQPMGHHQCQFHRCLHRFNRQNKTQLYKCVRQ
jgi:hypothetical protein